MKDSPVSDAEIDAYLDDELDLERRLAVEDYLAHTPAAAARLMADMRTRTALRLLASQPDPLPDWIRATGGCLARRLDVKPRLRLATAAAGMVAGAVLATLVPRVLGVTGDDRPSYVEDAVTSYETGLLRASMTSQIETPTFDAAEIAASTRISVPPLPDGWTITDVQVFPSDEGPSVQIMIDTNDQQRISLFAVHALSTAPISPAAIRHGKASVAFWQAGGVSYALTGMESPEALDQSAELLAVGIPGRTPPAAPVPLSAGRANG